MEAQVLVGVGDVLRVRHAAHVPRSAVERVLQRPDARPDLLDGGFLAGHVVEENQAVQTELSQRFVKNFVFAHVVIVFQPSHICLHDISIPQHMALVVISASHSISETQVPGEEIPREFRRVVLRAARDVVGPSDPDGPIGRDRGALNREIGGDIGCLEEFLTGGRIDA